MDSGHHFGCRLLSVKSTPSLSTSCAFPPSLSTPALSTFAISAPNTSFRVFWDLGCLEFTTPVYKLNFYRPGLPVDLLQEFTTLPLSALSHILYQVMKVPVGLLCISYLLIYCGYSIAAISMSLAHQHAVAPQSMSQ